MDASNEEASQEDEARLQATRIEENFELVREALRQESEERRRRDREFTPEQREHIAQRTAFKVRLAEEAAKVNRAREQEEEQVSRPKDWISPHEIVGETDAYKWADYWLQVSKEYPQIVKDRDAMMTWFANAIMAGYDSASKPSPKRIVHVKVGGEFGDGQPPWIPGPNEIAEARQQWQTALGTDYLVIVTHHMTEADFQEAR